MWTFGMSCTPVVVAAGARSSDLCKSGGFCALGLKMHTTKPLDMVAKQAPFASFHHHLSEIALHLQPDMAVFSKLRYIISLRYSRISSDVSCVALLSSCPRT